MIAGAYLSGTNTRRVRRALVAVFGGAVSKDTVSRVWRKVRGDWEAWNRRSLAEEPIVRLILDGTVVRVRLDKKATAISLLVVLGVREDGQKVLLAVQNMGGETQEAWRAVLDDLVKRGLRKPALLIVYGGAGLDAALTALWGDVPTQRCTVHKHRNLLAHAPERLIRRSRSSACRRRIRRTAPIRWRGSQRYHAASLQSRTTPAAGRHGDVDRNAGRAHLTSNSPRPNSPAQSRKRQ